ncbi:MAG: serine/threonine protein kinase [Planctomycetia bacterium]|nr:serine/threonine protein kinase [Planctomycetia bacterium]
MLGLTREANLGNSAVAETQATARLRHALAADLGPRYQVHEFLGRGAYATVWKVYDRITEELVAVKRFAGTIARADGFYRELHALFRLRHERIVKVINLSESAAGARHLILEYCAGGNLRSALQRALDDGISCPPWRARVLALQLAEGLAAAHRLGLVHRDLKPENILLDRPDAGCLGGQAGLKLVDFGLARALRRVNLRRDEAAPLSPLSGSPTYMAPEQFDDRFSPASDLYALGVVLYELLHGQPPFVGLPEALAYQHLRAAPAIDASLPAPWPALLSRLLDKSPATRCTLPELIEALGQRDTDRRTHPARASAAPFARLREPAFDLLPARGDAEGWDFLAVGANGLLRFAPATGAARGGLALPGLHHACRAADGSLWLTQADQVLRVRPGGVETVRQVPRGVEALACRVLADGSTRCAVVVESEVREFGAPERREPLWTRPIRSLGLRPRLLGLSTGQVVYTEGPLQPGLVILDLDGTELASVPLPGPCWQLGLWPHSDRLYALLLVGTALRPCRIDLDRCELVLFEPVDDLILLTAGAAGPHTLYGLRANGKVVGWLDSDELRELFHLDLRDTTFQALATDGHAFGVLCRSQGASWVHFHTLTTQAGGASRP